jgi:TPR repeat protein
VDAQAQVALIYQDGRGTVKNLERAFHYYLQAANGDDRSAHYHVSMAYLKGFGVAQNITEAIRWMERAATDPNYLLAHVALAQYFIQNLPISIKPDRLIAMLEPSANPPLNYGQVQFILGRLYLALRPPQPEKARQYFEAANRAGIVSATNELATMSLRGIGGPANFQDAIRRYEQAADRSSAAGLRNLGILYSGQKIEGVASPPGFADPARARECFQRAADLGDRTSMVKFGMLIFREVEEDMSDVQKFKRYAEARKWFKRAADAGDLTGLHNYGKMKALGQGGPIDMKVAIDSLLSAAERGFVPSYRTVADLVEEGKNGLKKDADQARRLRERANELERIKTGKVQ